MLPHTTSVVSAFPEDDVGRPTQFASKTGVGTTGLFLCSNDTYLNALPAEAKRFTIVERLWRGARPLSA